MKKNWKIEKIEKLKNWKIEKGKKFEKWKNEKIILIFIPVSLIKFL